MLDVTAIFLIVAVIAGLLGLIGGAVIALSIAKVGFAVFMVLVFVTLGERITHHPE